MYGGRLVWMLGTSAIIVMLPLMLEVDREQLMAEQIAEQAKQRERMQAYQAQQVRSAYCSVRACC